MVSYSYPKFYHRIGQYRPCFGRARLAERAPALRDIFSVTKFFRLKGIPGDSCGIPSLERSEISSFTNLLRRTMSESSQSVSAQEQKEAVEAVLTGP
eukprot:1350910-Amorphochlora_amoeboformis.AAC.2